MRRKKDNPSTFLLKAVAVLVCIYFIAIPLSAIGIAPTAIQDMVESQEVAKAKQEAESMEDMLVVLGSTTIGILLLGSLGVIIQQKKNRKALREIAYVDSLTGLPNLNGFKEKAAKILKDNKDQKFMLFKFDIYQFKVINDLFGFETGDKVILALGEMAKSVLHEEFHVLARISGDTFLLLDNYYTEESIDQGRRMASESFGQYISSMINYKTDLRIGRYLLESGETDVNAILEKVNIAHGEAKKHNRGEFCEYDETLRNQLLQERRIENRMEEALKQEEFVVYLQPKYLLKNEQVVGVEALVRWKQGDQHVAFPNEFIPIFERTGFIIQLDLYMFERVCKLIQGWIQEGRTPLPVSVNFSRLHLFSDGFVSQLEAIAALYQVPRKYIEIELTETAIFDNAEILVGVQNKLHNAGFILSMDDFGSGYSSLGLLKDLPVDIIKMDRNFFVGNQYKTRGRIVIESVIQMAKRLQIVTVAEGVETKEHIDFLREVGCDIVQGYYYARPMPAEKLFDNIPEGYANPTDTIFSLIQTGDISLGRDQFGTEMPVVMYRLFQNSLRKILGTRYGEDEMLECFREAGRDSGRSFAKDTLNLKQPLDEFFKSLGECLAEVKVGNLEVEAINKEENTFMLAIRNDLDCSGMEDVGKTLCQYDEGFIAGLLHEYTQAEYSVVEINCWGTGADLCRFEVRPK